jgi:protein ImuB
LCISLPHWPIARHYRRRFDWRADPAAVVADVGQARRIVDTSPRAARDGVRRGMGLAEARALSPGLRCTEHDPAGDRRALESLGRWMTRFTPVVAAGWDPSGRTDEDGGAGTHVLFLDITGCGRLFGGTGNIVARVAAALRHFRVPGNVAVAPTVGAAWAFASCGGVPERVVGAGELRDAISPLPPHALRIGDEVLSALSRLGFHTIGQLLALPREHLPARFGTSLLRRLDQATGDRPELLTSLSCPPPIEARTEFDFPIASTETMEAIFESLLDRVVEKMARHGLGAIRLDLACVPDHSSGHSAVTKTIDLTRACRDPGTLLGLIRGGVELLGCDRGFVAFRLNVPLYERIVGGEQSTAFGGPEDADLAGMERLADRLRLRLGAAAVIRPALVGSYLPERSWRPGDATTAEVPPRAVRPLCLLPVPDEIRVVCEPSDDRVGSPRQFTFGGTVHRLTHAVGPERVVGEWWRGREKVRDYYDVEDETGRRFWIFRAVLAAPTRWFLHGRFQ